MPSYSSRIRESADLTVEPVTDHCAVVLRERKVLVGFDGFVDNIVTPVATRHGGGEAFKPIETTREFAELIRKAGDGKNANIELFRRLQKVGGNGPILANALSIAGCQVRYVGGLGWPSLHPVFKEFAERTEAISLAEPGVTTALEFSDGKIMLGMATSLDAITYERILETVGQDRFQNLVGESDIVAFVDWTMVSGMTDILTSVLERVLPRLSKTATPKFFFDLADPAKRLSNELRTALQIISCYQNFGSVCLGLNGTEAFQVAKLLQVSAPDEASIDVLARKIRRSLKVDVVLVHVKEGAACADASGTQILPSPRCSRPVVKTGAGDHFNAGYIIGQLLGLEPQKCLPLAIASPSLYLRSGSSPTLDELKSIFTDENLEGSANAFPEKAAPNLSGGRGLSSQPTHTSQL